MNEETFAEGGTTGGITSEEGRGAIPTDEGITSEDVWESKPTNPKHL